MHDWLLSLWDVQDKLATDPEIELGCFNVTALPGWVFGRALALRAKADAEKSKVSYAEHLARHRPQYLLRYA